MINGKEIVLFVQPFSATSGGLYVTSSTENSHSIENELIDEQTKDGRILAYGQNSESFEVTAYGEKGDPGQKAIIDAIRNKEKLKLWEVNTVANDQGSYDALYAEVLVESVEFSNPNDSFQEISATLQVIGESKEGVLTTLPDMPTSTDYDFEEPATTTGV